MKQIYRLTMTAVLVLTSATSWAQGLKDVYKDYFLVGVVSGLTILRFIEAAQLWRRPGRMLAWFLLLVGVMYLGMVVEIAVHEAGHLVFGLLTGYRFFECFACLNKSCYQSVEIGTEVLGANQQNLVAFVYQYDDCCVRCAGRHIHAARQKEEVML